MLTKLLTKDPLKNPQLSTCDGRGTPIEAAEFEICRGVVAC